MEDPKAKETEEQMSIDQKERQSLEELKTLIKEDDAIKDLPLDDEFLIILIRARRCRPHLAMQTIKTLIEYKTKTYPELFEHLEAESVKQVLDGGLIGVVKRYNDTGPAVIVFRCEKWNTRDATMDELIAAGFLYAFQIAKSSVEVQRNGIIMLIDVGGFGFSHARQCSYGSVMKMANCIIFGSPFRIIACSLVKSPYIFEKFYKVVKFAIPEKFRSYVTVTKNDFTQLHTQISPKLLPESLGGEVPEQEAWELGLEQSICEDNQVSKFLKQISPFVK